MNTYVTDIIDHNFYECIAQLQKQFMLGEITQKDFIRKYKTYLARRYISMRVYGAPVKYRPQSLSLKKSESGEDLSK